jgi:hypothetical protein
MHPIPIMIYSLNLKQFFDFMQASQPVGAWEKKKKMSLVYSLHAVTYFQLQGMNHKQTNGQ